MGLGAAVFLIGWNALGALVVLVLNGLLRNLRELVVGERIWPGAATGVKGEPAIGMPDPEGGDMV
jgi:hypothetical protein